MPTALIYSDELMKYELSKEHPLNQIRLKLTYELIRSYGMLSNLFLYNPNYADEEKILLAHDKDYVDYVKEKSKSPEEDFLSSIYCLGTGDNPIFPGMYEASSLHVGGTILACELVLDRKAEHSFFLGGGFHHAKKSNAWGFCIFNDIVIAIKHIKRKYGLKKIMYLDIDAHHCDGVQEAFYSDPTVLKVSFHESGETLFPGTGYINELGGGEGKGYNINIPLPRQTYDEPYLLTFNEIVPKLMKAYKPELIIMQCGVDAHFSDPLTGLRLKTNAYGDIAKKIHELVHEYCDGNLVFLGGGGYEVTVVPRAWVLMLSKIAELDIDNNIPIEWIELCKKTIGREPSKELLDNVEVVDEKTKKIVYKIVERNLGLIKIPH